MKDYSVFYNWSKKGQIDLIENNYLKYKKLYSTNQFINHVNKIFSQIIKSGNLDTIKWFGDKSEIDYKLTSGEFYFIKIIINITIHKNEKKYVDKSEIIKYLVSKGSIITEELIINTVKTIKIENLIPLIINIDHSKYTLSNLKNFLLNIIRGLTENKGIFKNYLNQWMPLDFVLQKDTKKECNEGKKRKQIIIEASKINPDVIKYFHPNELRNIPEIQHLIKSDEYGLFENVFKKLFTKKEKISQEELDKKLCQAVYNDNLKMVKKYLKLGANINVRNYDGYTPLILASQQNNLGIVKYLVKNGADLEIENNDKIAFDYAKIYGNSNIENYLKIQAYIDATLGPDYDNGDIVIFRDRKKELLDAIKKNYFILNRLNDEDLLLIINEPSIQHILKNYKKLLINKIKKNPSIYDNLKEIDRKLIENEPEIQHLIKSDEYGLFERKIMNFKQFINENSYEESNIIINHIKMLSNLVSDKQRAYHQWILDNGKVFNKYDKVKDVANYKHFINNAKTKGCYYNSQLASLTGELKYWEGWFIDEKIPFPIEHAWNTTLDDKILDCTSIKMNFTPSQWFGVEIPKEFVDEYVKKHKTADSLLLFYWRKNNNI